MNKYPSPMPTSNTQVDVRDATSCVEVAGKLLKAYYGIMTGQGRVTIRFQERWTEFQKGNSEELKAAYMNLYRQCPGCRSAGLPDLAVSGVKRGSPSRGLQFFPRQ